MFQLLPQIFINYKRHNTEGLQPSMMLLWAAAGVPLGVYNIVEEFNIALRIQPQILTILSLITWAQCLYYGKVRDITFNYRYGVECTSGSAKYDLLNYSNDIEIPNNEMHNFRPPSPICLRRDRNRSNLRIERSQDPRYKMADYSHGCLKCFITRCRCIEALLGYICASHG